MSEDRRQKTLTYHRAAYSIEQPSSISLGMCIKEAFVRKPGWETKTIPRSGGQSIKLAKYHEDANKGHFLHLTFDTPGEWASIVPHPHQDASEIDVSTAPPPNNAEFMDADAFVYVRENHLCLCTTSVSLRAIDFFLREFFQRSGVRRDACDFQLLNVLDRQKVNAMLKIGVKEIDLHGTLYDSTVTFLKRRTEAVGLLYTVSKHCKALFGNEHDVSPDGIGVGVTLKVRRSMKGHSLGTRRLGDLAQNIIAHQEADDEFAIILSDNKKITASEIVLRETVEIAKHGKSVDRNEAWRYLEQFYNNLDAMGGFVE